MNIGEAIAHGLLGGTAAAADHYVSDWREKTRMAREQAYRKEGWQFEAEQAEKQRAHASSEAVKDRDFRAEQAEENVERGLRLAEGQAEITNRDRGQRYALAEDGKTLIPITPDADGSIPLPVAQTVGGNFSYLGVGKDGKGLLKGGGGSGSGSSGPKSVKSGSGMVLNEGSIERDADGRLWQYVMNPQTNQFERVPVISRETAPVISTPEQISAAETFAEETVNDLAGWFSTDATNFEAWGGSREAAKEYFKQGYLNGTLFDEHGKLMMPEQEQPSQQNTETTQDDDAQVASAQLYQSLDPKKQEYVQLFISHINQGSDRDLMIQRMIDLGFTEEELSVLFPAI